MSIEDELLADESSIFSERDVSHSICFTTVKKNIFDNQLAIVNQTNTIFEFGEEIQVDSFNTNIMITRSLYNKITATELNLKGSIIYDKKDGISWEVVSQGNVDAISASFICTKNIFKKAKA